MNKKRKVDNNDDNCNKNNRKMIKVLMINMIMIMLTNDKDNDNDNKPNHVDIIRRIIIMMMTIKNNINCGSVGKT